MSMSTLITYVTECQDLRMQNALKMAVNVFYRTFSVLSVLPNDDGPAY